MGAYAALAAGLINLRYQSGAEGNLAESLVLIIPGAYLLGISLVKIGKAWLNRKAATIVVTIVGGLLLAYSFLL